MGNGYLIKCKKCNYVYEAMLGIGMMFPTVYQNAVSEIKEGIYGEEYKRFFADHKNAAVNCEGKVAVCTQCGNLETVADMSLYLPDDGVTCDDNYVMPDDLESDYQKCLEYAHKCIACGGNMKIINFIEELTNGNLKCPECGEKLELDESSLFMNWD